MTRPGHRPQPNTTDQPSFWACVSHSCPGFRTQLAMVPADSVAVVFMSNAMGVDTRLFTSQALEIVGPAIGKAKDAKDKPEDSTEAKPANLDRYTGLYQSAWGEEAIFEWQGSLASIGLPTTRPMRALAACRVRSKTC